MNPQDSSASKDVLQLRSDTSGCESAAITFRGLDLQVSYTYYKHGKNAGSIVFGQVVAFRFHDTKHGEIPIDRSFNRVVEVIGSSWLAELVASESPGLRNSIRCARHFAVFISDVGYLEVVAHGGVSEA